MKDMTSNVYVGDFDFTGMINSFGVVSDRRNLSDTGHLILPNVEGAFGSKIKKGAPVEILAGYDGDNEREFKGYVSHIRGGEPIELMLEDEMWKLKQQKSSKSWKVTTLADVVRHLVPGVELATTFPMMELKAYEVDTAKSGSVYAELKLLKRYGLDIYYRGDTLYAGLAYQEGNLGVEHFRFGLNCLIGPLEFCDEQDINIRLLLRSFQPDGKMIQVEVGDPDGETHTSHHYGLSESELKAIGAEELPKFNYSGYRGGFMSFGIPKLDHGMAARLYDDIWPEREGAYFIDGVETLYNDSEGFVRYNQLGRKANT